MLIKSLKPLVMMQLKDKIDLSFLKSKKQTISKIILSICAFAVITAVIYGLLYVAKMLKIFHLVDIIPVSVIVVVFTIMQVLALISCTYGLMKNLYFAKDNQVLLTLPVTNNQVFVSKIIVFYLYELLKNCYFILPLFYAYGLISGSSFLIYLWAPICVILFSALTVAISALFSIFAMLINIFLKNFGIIRVLLFVGIVGVAIWGIVYVINLIPADLDIVGTWGTIFWGIQDFLSAFTMYAYPFTKLTELAVGGYVGLQPVLFSLQTLWILLSVIAVICVSLGLAFLISRPIFFKMASKPFEYRKVTLEKHLKNKVHNSFLSSVKKELLVIFRTSDDLFSLAGTAIALPILILLLNRIFASMSTRLLGDYMTVSFNLLIILLIALSSNGKIASIYSREGGANYLIKTRPTEYSNSLIAKLVPNAVIMTISIIASVIVFSLFTSLSVINSILLAFSVEFVYLFHLLWSAEMDIMNPQWAQYATTGNHVNNPNETKSSVAMFFLAFVFFGISLFLSIENVQVSWIKVFVIALVLLIYRVWSILNKIKYYYKEK